MDRVMTLAGPHTYVGVRPSANAFEQYYIYLPYTVTRDYFV
jgi:hypothetical protein